MDSSSNPNTEDIQSKLDQIPINQKTILYHKAEQSCKKYGCLVQGCLAGSRQGGCAKEIKDLRQCINSELIKLCTEKGII